MVSSILISLIKEGSFHESLELARQIGHRWPICETQGELARLEQKPRQIRSVQQRFQMMLIDTGAMKARLLAARTLFGLAQVLAGSESIITARNLAQESLDLFTDLDDRQCRPIAHWLSIYTWPIWSGITLRDTERSQ